MTAPLEDYYNEPENCGVEFCANVRDPADDLYLQELLGECDEGDEECISRFMRERGKPSGSFSVDKTGSKTLKTSGSLSGGVASSRSKTPTPNASMPPTPEKLFEDLPSEYFKKKFEPDYPLELQMKQVCTAKPQRRRTLGVTRTQPRAVFIPSRTTMDTRIDEMISKAASSAAKSKNKSIAALSGLRTSSPKVAVEPQQGFAMDRSPLEQNRAPPPVESSSDEIIVDWMEDHNIQMMFEYFLGLCVIYQPENPWAFISAICSKMMEARTDLTTFDRLPRVLTPEHTEAIFRIYDRIENGYITVPQYKAAMDAMGLSSYSTSPSGWEENAITKDTFVKEATDAIENLLRSFMVFEQAPVVHKSDSKAAKAAPRKKPEKREYSGSASSVATNSRSTYSRSGSESPEDENDGEEEEEEEEAGVEQGVEEFQEYENEEEVEYEVNEAYGNEEYEDEEEAEEAPPN